MVMQNDENTVPDHPIPNASPVAPKRCPTKSVTVVGPNGGGVKKTKTTLVIGSAMKACGRDVLFLCGDPGIGSLSQSLKVGGPHHVEFFPTNEDPNYAATLTSELIKLGLDHVLIDLGANVMLNAATMRTMRKALQDMRTQGYDIFVVLSITSGKTGLDGDAMNFARQFANVADVRLAFHGNSRVLEAGNFAQLTGIYPWFDVPEDEPAILRLINEAGVTPFDWCQSAPNGFQMAAGIMAENLIALAKQPGILPMIDPIAVTAQLSSIAANGPKRRFQPLTRPRDVRDTVLRANESLLTARSHLHGRSIDDSDAVLADTTRQQAAGAFSIDLVAEDLGDGGEVSAEDILAAQMSARAAEDGVTYVAFTATPKTKTMELFGRRPNPQAPAGETNKPAPFHVYSMRQAIEEGFILDVLKNYTPYKLAFKLASESEEWNVARRSR